MYYRAIISDPNASIKKTREIYSLSQIKKEITKFFFCYIIRTLNSLATSFTEASEIRLFEG